MHHCILYFFPSTLWILYLFYYLTLFFFPLQFKLITIHSEYAKRFHQPRWTNIFGKESSVSRKTFFFILSQKLSLLPKFMRSLTKHLIFIECLCLMHIWYYPIFVYYVLCLCVKKQVFQPKNNLQHFKEWETLIRSGPNYPKLFLSFLPTLPHPPTAAGHPLLFECLWSVRPTCVLTCHPFFGTASGPPADLAQAAAQGGFGAAGFQLPRPVRQGICSGVFETDEVGEAFWGAKLHSVCSQDKTNARGKSWTRCLPWIGGQTQQSDFWIGSLAAK